MNIDDLSTAEKEALPRALVYWVARWDWECPTLFGLEKSDFQVVLDAWPESLTLREETTSLAIIGALRELLFGASAVNADEVQTLLGISSAEAEGLLSQLSPRVNHVVG